MVKKEKTTPENREVRILNKAFQDIDEIIDFIAITNQQPLNAIKVSEKIWETIDRIAFNPFAFKECEELPTVSKLYRKAVCYSWQIIYKVTSAEIVVLGLVHNSRKPSKIRKLRKSK